MPIYNFSFKNLNFSFRNLDISIVELWRFYKLTIRGRSEKIYLKITYLDDFVNVYIKRESRRRGSFRRREKYYREKHREYQTFIRLRDDIHKLVLKHIDGDKSGEKQLTKKIKSKVKKIVGSRIKI